MKRIFTLAFLMSISVAAMCATWTVTSVNTSFSPDSITIQLGDSVHFTLGANHDAREVSQATYNANGTTSNGGFDVTFGGGYAVPAQLTLGVHYYVCINHVMGGMKGRIYVVNTTGIDPIAGSKPVFTIFPNPTTKSVSVNYSVDRQAMVSLRMVTLEGKVLENFLSEIKIPGSYVGNFDLENRIAKGTYLIELTVGENRTTQKVIVE